MRKVVSKYFFSKGREKAFDIHKYRETCWNPGNHAVRSTQRKPGPLPAFFWGSNKENITPTPCFIV